MFNQNNKAMTKFISSLIGLVLLASCVKDTVLPAAVDYFPLQVGNYWVLSFGGTSTIDQIVTLNGIDYYRMIHVQVWPNSSITKDTAFYRKTADGKVYQRGTKSSDEILKYDFGAASGQTWTYAIDPTTTFNPHPMNVTLVSISDTVRLGNDTIRSSYRYYYDVPQTADEETIVWLAPGIGIVKKVYLGGTSDRIALTKAMINGVVKQF
jgi:hypothetical protein